MSISIKAWKKVTPTDPMPMGVAARKYYVVSTMLTTLFHNCKPDAKKRKPPSTEPDKPMGVK